MGDPAPNFSATEILGRLKHAPPSDRHSEKRGQGEGSLEELPGNRLRVWGGAGIEFIVSVKEPPVKGLANKAIIKVLAEHFDISQVRIKIVSGWTSR